MADMQQLRQLHCVSSNVFKTISCLQHAGTANVRCHSIQTNIWWSVQTVNHGMNLSLANVKTVLLDANHYF